MQTQLFYRDKRILLSLALIAALCASFWLSSRYPALDAKALMSGSLSFGDGLSFEALIDQKTSSPFIQDVLITFVNWLYTNYQGMLFGMVLAVLMMVIVPLLVDALSHARYPLLRTIAGFFIGTPLGVCVNCAAPIAYGLYRRGASIELSLATMISSPTMNIVVLSVAFSLLPAYLVWIKIGFSLLAIFIVPALLAYLIPGERYYQLPAQEQLCEIPSVETYDNVSWGQALSWLYRRCLGEGVANHS